MTDRHDMRAAERDPFPQCPPCHSNCCQGRACNAEPAEDTAPAEDEVPAVDHKARAIFWRFYGALLALAVASAAINWYA